MPERIVKLQPDRTLSLRGFNSFAAAATIHDASPTGFRVSGTFRDPADFAVAVLYDADNVYEHPSIKYLPDFNFAGLTRSFNLNYTDTLQPIDSPKYNWIDWATPRVRPCRRQRREDSALGPRDSRGRGISRCFRHDQCALERSRPALRSRHVVVSESGLRLHRAG